jgi:hypothetical protein
MNDYLITSKEFRNIDINDPFFDSLKADYKGFEQWFHRKHENRADIIEDKNGNIQAFLYLKQENGLVNDTVPVLPAKKRIKVGTFKVNPHGTRIGERFIKRLLNIGLSKNVDEMYVTIFPKHTKLKSLLEKYGFLKVAEKISPDGTEDVLLKSFTDFTGDMFKDFPFVHTKGKAKYLLSIKPEYHTDLLPDSMLKNESFDSLEDTSHTNSIHKIYISFADLGNLRTGDNIVMYRTSDGTGPAYYTSVASSLVVVESVKRGADFSGEQDFINTCAPYSVFKEGELKSFWRQKRHSLSVIKFTYNIAFPKRINRKALIEEIGLNGADRWTFLPITDSQFEKLIISANVKESLVID